MYTRIVSITDNNICIANPRFTNSVYKIRMRLEDLRIDYPNNLVLRKRSIRSLVNQWLATNNLVKLKLCPNKVSYLNLTSTIRWYNKLIYWFLSKL